MTKLLGTTTFLLTLLVSPLMAEWKEFNKMGAGNGGWMTSYVDISDIRVTDKYVYWWHKINHTKPIGPVGQRRKSNLAYIQGDCERYKYAFLELSLYKEEDLKQLILRETYDKTEWNFPSRGDFKYNEMKFVCNYVGR